MNCVKQLLLKLWLKCGQGAESHALALLRAGIWAYFMLFTKHWGWFFGYISPCL